MSSNPYARNGEDGSQIEQQNVNAEGCERSSTDIWLMERNLNEFIQILKGKKLDIATLLECSRDELFAIFKGIGLEPHENVRLRFAITKDKRWKGDTSILFALKEKTHLKVQQISLKLSESSATLAQVEDAKIAVGKICDNYLDAVAAGVKEILVDAHQKIENTRMNNEKTVKALTEAQQDIDSVVKSLPVHENNAREKGIAKIMEEIENKLTWKVGFSLESLMSPKPNFNQLKKAIDSLFTFYSMGFKWDRSWKSTSVTIAEKGLKVIAPRCRSGQKTHVCARGSVGWTKGKHTWKIQYDSLDGNQCTKQNVRVSSRAEGWGWNDANGGWGADGGWGSDNAGTNGGWESSTLEGDWGDDSYNSVCRKSSVIGVCSELMTKDDIIAGRCTMLNQAVGYSPDSRRCIPSNWLLSGKGFVTNRGEIIELTLDLTKRTLKIANGSSFMLVKVPRVKGKIFPWVKLQRCQHRPNSCTLVDGHGLAD